MTWRHGIFGLLAISLIGCEQTRPFVYVNLDAIPEAGIALPERALPKGGQARPLPSEQKSLAVLEGADLALADTKARMDQARALIRQNREAARRSLAAGLYRAYAKEAEAARTERERSLRLKSDALWDEAFKELSAKLKNHARRRFPLSVRLAFLVGFPFEDPAQSPRPERVWGARRYDEAVEAWKKLLEEDADFAKVAEALLEEVESKIAQERVEIQVEFARRLNEYAARSGQEADASIESYDAEFPGALASGPELTVRAESERERNIPSLGAPKAPSPRNPVVAPEARQFLEHELRIWLAQNGYRRAMSPGTGVDRTEEFRNWIDSRRNGP